MYTSNRQQHNHGQQYIHNIIWLIWYSSIYFLSRSRKIFKVRLGWFWSVKIPKFIMPHYSDNLYTVIVDIGVKGIYKFWWLDILGSFREEVVWKYGKIFILNSGFIIIQKKLSIYSLSLLIFFFFFWNLYSSQTFQQVSHCYLQGNVCGLTSLRVWPHTWERYSLNTRLSEYNDIFIVRNSFVSVYVAYPELSVWRLSVFT